MCSVMYVRDCSSTRIDSPFASAGGGVARGEKGERGVPGVVGVPGGLLKRLLGLTSLKPDMSAVCLHLWVRALCAAERCVTSRVLQDLTIKNRVGHTPVF